MCLLCIHLLLFLPFLSIQNLLSIVSSILDRLDFQLQLHNSILEQFLPVFTLLDLMFKLGFSLFSLSLFLHSELDSVLIQSLVCSNCHLDLISHSQEEESSLRFVDCDLPDYLIKALAEQLFSDWTDSTLSSLPLHELGVQEFPQSCHIDS